MRGPARPGQPGWRGGTTGSGRPSGAIAVAAGFIVVLVLGTVAVVLVRRSSAVDVGSAPQLASAQKSLRGLPLCSIAYRSSKRFRDAGNVVVKRCAPKARAAPVGLPAQWTVSEQALSFEATRAAVAEPWVIHAEEAEPEALVSLAPHLERALAKLPP